MRTDIDTTVSVELEYEEEVLEFVEVSVTGSIDETPGFQYCRNGDPGEPGSVEIVSCVDFDLQTVIDTLELHFTEEGRTVPAWVYIEAPQVLEELVDKVKEQVRGM